MSNAIHALGLDYMPGHAGTACGKAVAARFTSGVNYPVARVTCKRCLASLAKRDREFQEKANRHVTRGHGRRWTDENRTAVHYGRLDWHDAARAIAREEGRAL